VAYQYSAKLHPIDKDLAIVLLREVNANNTKPELGATDTRIYKVKV